ncbi:hypothetical protein VV869_18590 [Photobacterium sp. MCCC 1A19761]|uniref:hypothetical protein n=1 Tax=Photobacterium sp. MCCC 1A19761 TaxID=3115000 RepID=UPI00307F13E2
MQEFNIDKRLITLMKFCLIFFVVLMVSSLMMPFIPGEADEDFYANLRASIFGFVVCSGFTALAYYLLRKLPYTNVVADNDGLWYKHLGKERGLVRWRDISSVKQRLFLQSMDLLDEHGKQLLRIEYQLIGFPLLRATIADKLLASVQTEHQTYFCKSKTYHLFNVISLLLMLAGCVYLIFNDRELLGYSAILIILLGLHEYFTTIVSLRLTEKKVEMSYPFTKKYLSLSDIVDIQLVDIFDNSNLIPQIWIVSSHAKKPYRFNRLGVDEIGLLNILRKAVHKIHHPQ